MSLQGKSRISSLDILRGLVMVIMALDHVRDFFYKAELSQAADAALDPTNMETTYPALFFTRWITHFCAPVFVLLAGTSIYLMGQRLSKNELSIFLLKRGLWLVMVEITIVTFSWTFNPLFNILILQVIWAIGASMMVMALCVRLPYKAIFGLGAMIVVGHNILDFPVFSDVKQNLWMQFLFSAKFSFHVYAPNHFFMIVYSFAPWTGVMLLGYCLGKLFTDGVDAAYRRKMLLRMGLGITVAFVVMRFVNIYGDPVPWAPQPRGMTYTFLSFLNLNKYPPSLLFLCMAIGLALLALVWVEKMQNRFTLIMNVYGRVPMFYYVLHFYLIHLTLVVVFFVQGFGSKDIISPNNPFFFRPNGVGFGLVGVYVVWISVVVLLFPLCKKFGAYKNSHKQWWLSYI
jgi:uncharacterized membrane protein